MKHNRLRPPEVPRFVRASAIAVVAVLAAACGGSSTSGNQYGAPSGPAMALVGNPGPGLCQSGRTYTIGYDVFSDSEAFAAAFSKGLQDTASKIGCVKVTTLVDNVNPTTTVQNFNLLVQRKVDGVISFQVIADLYPGLLRTLTTAKIPMVTIGLSTPGAVFVNENDKNSGMEAGKLIATTFAAAHPGVMPYVFRGDYAAGGQTQTDRMDGYVAGIEAVLGNIPSNQIISIETKADPVVTLSAMKSALVKVPKDAYLLVAGTGDNTSNAMLQAAKGDGRAGTTFVVAIGIAGTDGPAFICANPQYVGGVAFQPEIWSNFAFPAIIGLIRGETVPNFVEVKTKAVARADLRSVIPTAPC